MPFCSFLSLLFSFLCFFPSSALSFLCFFPPLLSPSSWSLAVPGPSSPQSVKAQLLWVAAGCSWHLELSQQHPQKDEAPGERRGASSVPCSCQDQVTGSLPPSRKQLCFCSRCTGVPVYPKCLFPTEYCRDQLGSPCPVKVASPGRFPSRSLQHLALLGLGSSVGPRLGTAAALGLEAGQDGWLSAHE